MYFISMWYFDTYIHMQGMFYIVTFCQCFEKSNTKSIRIEDSEHNPLSVV